LAQFGHYPFKRRKRSGIVPILASVVRGTMELPKGTSPSYFTENIVTSTAVGPAERSIQTATLLKVTGKA
jgi:hypothetical protein